eukprot:1486027-Rhodomonas_salina.2
MAAQRTATSALLWEAGLHAAVAADLHRVAPLAGPSLVAQHARLAPHMPERVQRGKGDGTRNESQAPRKGTSDSTCTRHSSHLNTRDKTPQSASDLSQDSVILSLTKRRMAGRSLCRCRRHDTQHASDAAGSDCTRAKLLHGSTPLLLWLCS